jgi:hypothetical protein
LASDLTFVYEGFDYLAFLKQVEALQSSTKTYSFSMIISQGKDAACGVVIFSKSSADFIECITIDVNNNIKALIKQIIAVAKNKNQLKLFVARFIVAQYGRQVAQIKLEEIGFSKEHPLSRACGEEENNKKIIDDLVKNNEELKNSKASLDFRLFELDVMNNAINSGLKKTEEQLQKEKNATTALNAKIVELRAALAKNRWKYGCDLISNIFTALFRHASVPYLFGLALTYWMFLK